MERILLKARAKINLTLDIAGRRPDGYHELDSVMQAVSLADEVTLRKTAGGFSVSCEGGDVLPPSGEQNIAYAAAKAYFEAVKNPMADVDIRIRKQIPMQAGLGGGSADAAAVLAGLSRLFPAGLSEEDLLFIGASVGADVPFCLKGGCCRAEGIGERLTPLPVLPDCAILIVKPSVGISTAAAYAAFDRRGGPRVPHAPALCDALRRGAKLSEIGRYLGNAFLPAISVPAIGRLPDALHRAGAVGACMSGSGSAVFGLFADEKNARKAASVFSHEAVFLCRPAAESLLSD